MWKPPAPREPPPWQQRSGPSESPAAPGGWAPSPAAGRGGVLPSGVASPQHPAPAAALGRGGVQVPAPPQPQGCIDAGPPPGREPQGAQPGGAFGGPAHSGAHAPESTPPWRASPAAPPNGTGAQPPSADSRRPPPPGKPPPPSYDPPWQRQDSAASSFSPGFGGPPQGRPPGGGSAKPRPPPGPPPPLHEGPIPGKPRPPSDPPPRRPPGSKPPPPTSPPPKRRRDAGAPGFDMPAPNGLLPEQMAVPHSAPSNSGEARPAVCTAAVEAAAAAQRVAFLGFATFTQQPVSMLEQDDMMHRAAQRQFGDGASAALWWHYATGGIAGLPPSNDSPHDVCFAGPGSENRDAATYKKCVQVGMHFDGTETHSYAGQGPRGLVVVRPL
eukprot:TRINITY_DN10893_c0_g1_i1.p1 TRINITY_DN10893_c0_g1~~TRINITY_DN10893_c0_g1_i1.p1  ORF type:complete len:384 (+),score=24.81 TRINITY_DN10893_c0_g1_i1:68-1219(+)